MLSAKELEIKRKNWPKVPESGPERPFMGFYASLNPEYDNWHNKEVFENLEYGDKKGLYNIEKPVAELLPKPGESKEIGDHQLRGVFRLREKAEHLRYTFDLTFGSSLTLPFIISDVEVCKIIQASALDPTLPPDPKPSLLHRFPAEIRQRIYSFVIGNTEWFVGDYFSNKRKLFLGSFVGGMGDMSGFFYPVRDSIGLLSVSKEIRSEALPLVYRQTRFRVAELNQAVQLLVGIGRLGRENIENLTMDWNSETRVIPWRIKTDERRRNVSYSTAKVHAATVVQLLNRCPRLRSLGINFYHQGVDDDDDLEKVMNDDGIKELTKMNKVAHVNIAGYGRLKAGAEKSGQREPDPVKGSPFAEWLEGELQMKKPEEVVERERKSDEANKSSD